MRPHDESQQNTYPRGGVLSAIGGTPIVRFDRILGDGRLRIFAKLEALNPGGSAKDRPAANIVLAAVRTGLAIPGQTIVVESSSGNFAIGLAQVCRYLGLDLVCIVDPTVTAQNLAILRAYGATIDMVSDADSAAPTEGYLSSRLRRVREFLAAQPHAFWPNQYSNPLNSAAYAQTMHEIFQALDGRVDFIFCPVGTCGTLRGCAEFIHSRGLATRVVAVDAEGSVIFDRPAHRRLIPGHGASVRPGLYAPGLADEVIHVTDLECIAGCRHLVDQEAYLAGGSSGAVVAALYKLAPRIPAGDTCVLILPDRGDRYLDSIYSDPWVVEHFGTVPRWLDVAPSAV